jgi:hypothetical protein
VDYWKTFRVEFEPEETRDNALTGEASLNPIYRHTGQGFVFLDTAETHPESIVLTADLPILGTNRYGPLYIGSNYASLTATVKDSKGQLLENQSVTFKITSSALRGGFGSVGSTATGVTDEVGEARAYYNPPRTIDDIGETVPASGYSVNSSPSGYGSAVTETTTLRTNTLDIESDLNDIFLYEVTIDDPLVGWQETSINDDLDTQKARYYQTFFAEHGIYGPTGITTVSGLTTDKSIDWEETHREVWKLAKPVFFDGTEGKAGKKTLLATTDSSSVDPHTYTYSTTAPFQPIDIIDVGDTKFDVVFDTSTFDLPVPSGSLPTASGTLYGYYVVAPTEVSVQASVFNKRLNRNILSNTVDLKLQIPPYLSGVWVIDAINNTHINEISALLASVTASGQRVPLGFRLRSSNVTLAAALDGVTFLDVNPTYNADVFGTTAAPEMTKVVTSLGHEFNINSIV